MMLLLGVFRLSPAIDAVVFGFSSRTGVQDESLISQARELNGLAGFRQA